MSVYVCMYACMYVCIYIYTYGPVSCVLESVSLGDHTIGGARDPESGLTHTHTYIYIYPPTPPTARGNASEKTLRLARGKT